MLAGAAPGVSREFLEGSQIGRIRITRTLGLVGQIPNVRHQHRPDGVNGIVAVEPVAEQPFERTLRFRQTLRQLVLHDRMGRCVGTNVGQLCAYLPMIPARELYPSGFVERQPRRRVGIVIRIVLEHVG